MTIIISGVLIVAAFVFGVLFGRANKKKVEKALDEAHNLIAELKAKVK